MKSSRIEESTLRDWCVREDLRIETGFEHAVAARLRNLFRSHIDLLPARIPALHVLLPDQSATLFVDAVVCAPSGNPVLCSGKCGGGSKLAAARAWAKREHRFLIGAGRLLAAGVYLSLHPFLRVLEDNRTAYSWSLASLLPLIAFALWRQVGDGPVEQNGPENGQLGYSEGLLIAAAVSVIYTAGSRMRLYSETRTMAFHWSDAGFTLWSFIGSCALSVQANRRTPFANRRMKFYPRTITETQRTRWKRNSLAATSPGV
jgi:hypothetical protein